MGTRDCQQCDNSATSTSNKQETRLILALRETATGETTKIVDTAKRRIGCPLSCMQIDCFDFRVGVLSRLCST